LIRSIASEVPSAALASRSSNHIVAPGVNILSGSLVVDESAVMRTVGQGAGFQQVESVRLLTFRRD
jgi:hypothetical protein